MPTKYTKPALEEAVANSKSLADVLRFFGLKIAGSSYAYLGKKIKDFQIDISHFDGGRSRHFDPPVKLTADQILVFSDDISRRRTDAKKLRRALLEIGRKEECADCGVGTEWNGKKLKLQIEHIDGDFLNNLRENLLFLCPNCHSQTPTYGLTKSADLNKQVCECGRTKQARSKRCVTCHLDNPTLKASR